MEHLLYQVLWPGGNTTALVEKELPRALHPHIASRIMEADPDIEQVGFIEQAPSPQGSFHLQMMGGEFCGNAARSAAYFWAKKDPTVRSVLVSGLPGTLSVEVDDESASIVLPANFFRQVRSVDEGIIVDLQGIRHIIVLNDSTADHETLIRKYADEFPAIGVMKTEMRDQLIRIQPLVWVRETSTFIPETGCGSGSIAAAIAVHGSNRETAIYRVEQPSGEVYEIALHFSAQTMQGIRLSGTVLYQGERSIDL